MRKRFVGNMILVNWRYNGHNNDHEDARLRQQNSHMLVSRCSHASASWHSAQRTLRGIQKAIGKLNFVAGTLLFSLQALFISFSSFILCKFHNPTRQDRYQGASILCTSMCNLTLNLLRLLGHLQPNQPLLLCWQW